MDRASKPRNEIKASLLKLLLSGHSNKKSNGRHWYFALKYSLGMSTGFMEASVLLTEISEGASGLLFYKPYPGKEEGTGRKGLRASVSKSQQETIQAVQTLFRNRHLGN